MYIFIGIALLILAGVILYPKAKYNKSVKEQNDFLQKENAALNEAADQLIYQLDDLQNKVLNKEQELKLLNWKTQTIEESEEKIYKATKEKYETKLINDYAELNTEYTKMHEALAENYVEARHEAKQIYLDFLAEKAAEFKVQQSEISDQIFCLKEQLGKEQKKVEVAIAARKREEEEAEKRDFFKLKISTSDLEDIEKLSNVAQLLNTPEVLYKTIWKVYYEKPYTDLIGRVLGTKPITGIYKITNINNGKSYIGQAVNIQDRWRQHIKRGCGAETPTRNKLYPAMLEEGVHNFYFELLEECPREQLDAQEDYWQSFYQTNSYGYSIK